MGAQTNTGTNRSGAVTSHRIVRSRMHGGRLAHLQPRCCTAPVRHAVQRSTRTHGHHACCSPAGAIGCPLAPHPVPPVCSSHAVKSRDQRRLRADVACCTESACCVWQ